MYQTNEVVTFVLAVAVGGFASYQFDILRSVRHVRLLAASYLCWLAGWVFTIIEGYVAPTFFNGAEHAAEATAALLFTLWLHRIVTGEGTNP